MDVLRASGVRSGLLCVVLKSLMLVAGGCSFSSGPQRVYVPPQAPVGAASPVQSLEVMTINLEHHDEPAELKVMGEHLRSDLPKVPEFILCQEVLFQRGNLSRGEAENTAEVLARQVGYHCRGTKRSSDHEGIALLSKYPFEYYESRELRSQTLRILLGFNRVSVMGEFTVPSVGRVRVVNTHLTNWSWEGRVRRKQIAETLQWVAERQAAAPAVVTFFGGDFNSQSSEAEMRQLHEPITVAGRAEPMRFQDHNGTLPSQGDYGNPTARIDFIFVTGSRPVAFQGERLMWKDGLPVDGRPTETFFLSDHLAVVHTYELRSGSAAITRIE